MASFSDDSDDDRRQRGFRLPPSGQECRNGHLDWETTTNRRGQLVKRCRICGDERPFEGKVLPS